MGLVLHISDTHFGTEQPPVVDALLELAREQSPDLLVLSGDVTQRARRGQFGAALDFLRRVPVPEVMVLPGNHDIPLFNLLDRFVFPYRNHCAAFPDLEPEFESPELLVIGINTTRPSRHTQGSVSLEQIDRVCRRLRKAADRQLRIVVTHQPVRAIRDSDLKNLLRGHEGAVYAWSEAGADLILSGHVHLPHVRPLREVYPNLPRPVWSVLAGTAVSRRVRGETPNSVNLIRFAAGDDVPLCAVERWDYLAEGRFQLADRVPLELQRP